MFKSFSTLFLDCQTQTVDTSSTSLAYFKKKINESLSKAYRVLNTEYFYASTTDLTVASQMSYPLPYNCDKLHSIKITISSIDYVVIEFPGSEEEWIALTGGSGSSTSDYPTYFFVKRNTFEIYPKSSTVGYTMTIRYKVRIKELTQADYTTGNITTLANGGTVITGSGTAWSALFVGRFFKIDGDGHWYEISARSSNTLITLARKYGGTAIAAGSEAYTIGEGSLLPFDSQDIPINYTLWQYYKMKKRFDLANQYKTEWFENLADLKSFGGNLTTSGVIDEDISMRDPNDFKTLIT